MDTMEALLKRSKPWKDLTDRFDELSVTVDRVEGLVERDEQTIAQLDEAEGGDLSDLIVNFKVRGEGLSTFHMHAHDMLILHILLCTYITLHSTGNPLPDVTMTTLYPIETC